MRTVVLVAPYAMQNTLRYVLALCELEGVRAAVISADAPQRFPASVRERLAAFETVANCFDGHALAAAIKRIGARIGAVERVLGVLEQLQVPIALARDLAGVPGMGSAVVHRFRDKSAMKAALKAHGVPCARYIRAEKIADALALVDVVGYPIIVKPVDGLGSRATYRVSNRAELDQAFVLLRPSARNPVQAEEFLLGSEHSFETVTINGKHIWSSSTDYLPGPLEVMETPWIQYCVILPRETEGMARFADVNHAALDALGMQTGLSHMEWFLRRDGTVAVNEVGARPPGVNIMPMMSVAHGIDMTRAWVRLMALDEFAPPPVRKRAAGAAFFRGQGKGNRVVAVHGVREAQEEVGRYVVDAAMPHVGQARAEGYEGEGYAVVAAETTAEVRHALARMIRGIRVELG
jgi:biotin carboxylase